MPAFGTMLAPVRSLPGFPIEVNNPDGFPHDFPPGDLWWTGLHSWWESSFPPAVTRATAIITNPLVRMPWTIARPDGLVLAPGDLGYPTWLVDPMLAGGSSGGSNTGELPQLQRGTRFDVLSRWLRDALWYGTGILTARLDADGQPLAGTVEPGSPFRLGVEDDGTGGHRFVIEHRFVVGPIGDSPGVTTMETWRIDDRGMFGPEGQRRRVIVLRHALPGGVLGWHRTQLRLAEAMTAYAAGTFVSGVPSGVLSTDQPLTQAQADRSREEWATRQTVRSIAVLGNGTRYQPVAISPVDSELIAMSRASNESLAHAFELPAWYLDASTNTMTYNNAGWFRQDLVDGPLASWSARIEETVSALLPWGTRMVIDFTAYTRPIVEGGPDAATAPAA